jgi:hypothetical protein
METLRPGMPRGNLLFRTGGVTALLKEEQIGAAPNVRNAPSRKSLSIFSRTELFNKSSSGDLFHSNVSTKGAPFCIICFATPKEPLKRSSAPGVVKPLKLRPNRNCLFGKDRRRSFTSAVKRLATESSKKGSSVLLSQVVLLLQARLLFSLLLPHFDAGFSTTLEAEQSS